MITTENEGPNYRRDEPLSATIGEQMESENDVKPSDDASTQQERSGANGITMPIPVQSDINEAVQRRSDMSFVGRPGAIPSTLGPKGYDRQIKTLEDWMSAEGNRPETEAERKERERKERSKRIMAAVSDGFSALSNLFFTSHYAPSSYRHEKGATTTLNKHLDTLKAERERKADRYLDFALKLGDIENQKARTEREAEAQAENMRMAREQAEQRAEAHQWDKDRQPDILREQKGRADRAEALAAIEAENVKTAPALAEAKLESQKAQTAQRKASAAASGASAEASRARAGYYARGGAAGTKKHHFRGKEYVSEKDYTKDVTEAARDYNERHKHEPGFEPIKIERSETTAYGGQRISARRPEEFAGEVERRLEAEEADNTPPSRRKKDNKPPYRR